MCRPVDLGIFCLSQSTLSDGMGKAKGLCVRSRQAAWFHPTCGAKEGREEGLRYWYGWGWLHGMVFDAGSSAITKLSSSKIASFDQVLAWPPC